MKKRNIKFHLTAKKLIVILFVFIVSTASASTIHIPDDYSTIQAGIDAASYGDVVLVDVGTYVENINFNGKNITVASNYYTTQDTSYISQTVIDGDSSGSVVTFENEEGSSSELVGFTITNGYSEVQGGGIHCYDAGPTLQNLHIINNGADNGGGVCCTNDSNPTLEEVSIIGNDAFYNGGGIICKHSSSPILSDVVIRDNYTGADGGGMYCYLESSPSLTRVVIAANSSDYGGGIFAWSNSDPSLQNVTIVDNFSYYGGGIWCYYESDPVLVNSIVCNNFGDYGLYNVIDFAGEPDVSYSNFYGNEKANFYNCDPEVGINVTTNTNGDSCDVFYNIQLNPLFVNAANGDYHLSENSPCIDAGDPTFSLDPDSTIADMGAYYYNQNQAVEEEPPEQAENNLVTYPNPINSRNSCMSVKFNLRKPARVEVKLYNAKGQLVDKICENQMSQGYHTIENEVDDLSSGIYLIQLSLDGRNRAVQKLVKLD